MFFKRRKLGTTYTRSPAQNVQTAMAGNFSKVVFTIFIIITYLVILYVVVGIIRFLGTEFGNMPQETRVIDLYNSPYNFPVKVAGIVFIIFYVFRDKMTNR
ncbi:MAG TPA: hypothetical protein DCZ94_07330 [Lentisphaeria bacterium]|nr:MAG: hypothetical protein A2X48_20475 [Lentisphaerae bacterium GWF2_49_21]HBC86747.1 hypothetical protein [Lentisphaeria bacterium]